MTRNQGAEGQHLNKIQQQALLSHFRPKTPSRTVCYWYNRCVGVIQSACYSLISCLWKIFGISGIHFSLSLQKNSPLGGNAPGWSKVPVIM